LSRHYEVLRGVHPEWVLRLFRGQSQIKPYPYW
jgi:hypothetical protein